MNNSYVIQWKSKVNGRAGRGTKQFDKSEVEQLVKELNLEYPQIEHEAVPAGSVEAEPIEGAAVSDAPAPLLSPA